MNVDIEKYADLKICAAVSGGRDSMALLNILKENAEKYNITLTALNCDHCMRKTSAADSAFVKEYCQKAGIPLHMYTAEGKKFESEGEARAWRISCYLQEAKSCDCVATAHHLDDNAETVLFNLARGTSLAGMEGITDEDMSFAAGRQFRLIRPLISCTRAEIDKYVDTHKIPYRDDETNSSTDYTRNKIRHLVLPELERAVPGAASGIYRFSRLAKEDEDYFSALADKLISVSGSAVYIARCDEKVIFRRAAAKAVAKIFARRDYTAAQMQRLFELQYAENGKKFEFLGLTAYSEDGRICLAEERSSIGCEEADFCTFLQGATDYMGVPVHISECQTDTDGMKILRFDGAKIPQGATVRFARSGDKFRKFGGGTKKLGDFFTDKKIALRLRKRIPLLCDGQNVLIIFGVEISEDVKIDAGTKEILCAAAPDFANM